MANMMAELPTIGGPQVFKEGAMEEKGETARLSSFVGALAVVDLVKSTLGPKGMDKILQSMGRGKEVCYTLIYVLRLLFPLFKHTQSATLTHLLLV